MVNTQNIGLEHEILRLINIIRSFVKTSFQYGFINKYVPPVQRPDLNINNTSTNKTDNSRGKE